MSKPWWQDKLVYQIYPKSFCDANGDGVGDLAGVLSKLDYLKQLGVDLVWLSPIYRSPFVDQGYDVADYYAIDPAFGSMEQFDQLLAETRRRGMGVVMDLVVNHCSDQHVWFQKALADPTGPYADYFYFRPGKEGGPPSNYRAYFGGSAWEPVPGTDLYYLHSFAKQQPDLNWYNPALREEIFRMVNWWLDKGLAGFRVDAIINIQKQLDFPDYPADGPDGLASIWRMVQDAEGIEAFLGELRDRCFAPHDAFTVGEVFNLKDGQLRQFVGEHGLFSTIFDFAPHMLASGPNGWQTPEEFKFAAWRGAVFAGQAACPADGLLGTIIENHDEPRGSCRFLPAHAQNDAGAKMLGTASLLLRGIPFLYQGQELGMRNCPMASIGEYDDLETHARYDAALLEGKTPAEALALCQATSRDNARTPMQWNGGPGAGFTTGRPWMRLNPDYPTRNAAAQQTDENSVLRYYQRLIALRKSGEWGEVFSEGSFAPVWDTHPSLFAYRRAFAGRAVLVAANFGAQPVEQPLETPARLLLESTGSPAPLAAALAKGQLALAPCQAAVLALAPEKIPEEVPEQAGA